MKRVLSKEELSPSLTTRTRLRIISNNIQVVFQTNSWHTIDQNFFQFKSFVKYLRKVYFVWRILSEWVIFDPFSQSWVFAECFSTKFDEIQKKILNLRSCFKWIFFAIFRMFMKTYFALCSICLLENSIAMCLAANKVYTPTKKRITDNIDDNKLTLIPLCLRWQCWDHV